MPSSPSSTSRPRWTRSSAPGARACSWTPTTRCPTELIDAADRAGHLGAQPQAHVAVAVHGRSPATPATASASALAAVAPGARASRPRRWPSCAPSTPAAPRWCWCGWRVDPQPVRAPGGPRRRGRRGAEPAAGGHLVRARQLLGHDPRGARPTPPGASPASTSDHDLVALGVPGLAHGHGGAAGAPRARDQLAGLAAV